MQVEGVLKYFFLVYVCLAWILILFMFRRCIKSFLASSFAEERTEKEFKSQLGYYWNRKRRQLTAKQYLLLLLLLLHYSNF